jgi:hypothetical protein
MMNTDGETPTTMETLDFAVAHFKGAARKKRVG